MRHKWVIEQSPVDEFGWASIEQKCSRCGVTAYAHGSVHVLSPHYVPRKLERVIYDDPNVGYLERDCKVVLVSQVMAS